MCAHWFVQITFMYICTSTLIKWMCTAAAASSRLIERGERERGGERWRRMLAIICIVPSRQVWACEELSWCHCRWDTRTIIVIIQTVVMCTRVRNWWTKEKYSFENTAMSSLFISTKNAFFFFSSWISVSDKYILLMNNLSPAVYVYDLLLFRDTFVQLNFLMYI